MAQPDLVLGYLVSGGSTLSEDDSPQQNDAGAIMRGLSGKRAGPEDGQRRNHERGQRRARNHRRCQPSGHECARVIGEVRPPDKKQSLMSQFARPLLQHEGRALKAQNDAEFRAVQEKHAGMLAHNKANKRRPGRLGRGGRGHGRMSNAQQPATAKEQVEHVQET
eukprot:362300-Chlamydomonas_euryale.AAC.5